LGCQSRRRTAAGGWGRSIWAQRTRFTARVQDPGAGARNLAMGRIMGRADVYPVLRELFARKQKMAA
jgi:uncharacterized sporulation protein YeaH/YhbH (DUF444 family)